MTICATPGCGRALKNERWIFSTHTRNHYCWPGEGCSRWTPAKRRRARANALYEELRVLTDAELRDTATGLGIDVSGYGKQQVIASIIEAAPTRHTHGRVGGATDKPRTKRRKEGKMPAQKTQPAKAKPEPTSDETKAAATPDTSALHKALLDRVKALTEPKVHVLASPTGRYEILKVDGKTIGYVNPARTGVRVEARGTVAKLPAKLRESFVQRKPHLVAVTITAKDEIDRGVTALKLAAAKVATPDEEAGQG